MNIEQKQEAARKHQLKTWPQYFNAIKSGVKTFEIRENDRNFACGDILELREFRPCGFCRGSGRMWDVGDKIECPRCNNDHGVYTGEVFLVRVVYLTDFGQQTGQVVMSIVPVTVPIKNREEAARKCAEELWHFHFGKDSKMPLVDVEIILSTINEICEPLERELEELRKLARQACDERYETEQQATHERIRRNHTA